MSAKRVTAAVLTALLLLCCLTPAQAATTYTAYSSTNPKIPFSNQPTAKLSGTNRVAFSYVQVNSGGSITSSSKVTVGTATVKVLGFSRLHHAFAKIEYYNPDNQTTKQLWVEACHLRPAPRTRTEQFLLPDGSPLANWPVRVVDGRGEEITTVQTDEHGVASYTGIYLDLDEAFAFASRMWSNSTIGSGALIENNDCATFVSECLTVGGFGVYAPYASRNTSRNPGQGTYYYGLFNQLTHVLGVPYTTRPSGGTIDVSQIYPGDVAFMHPATMSSTADTGPYGHTVLVEEANPETREVLTFSHSGYWHEWKSVDDPNHAILAVVHTSIYHFTFAPVPVVTLPETLTVPVGIPMPVAAEVEPACVTAPTAWSVEPEGILTVEEGVLTATAPGTATLTATVDGVSASCQVTACVPSRLPEGTVSLEAEAFSGAPIPYLILPASLTDIHDQAFDGCDAVLIVEAGSPAALWVESRGMEHLILPAE